MYHIPKRSSSSKIERCNLSLEKFLRRAQRRYFDKNISFRSSLFPTILLHDFTSSDFQARRNKSRETSSNEITINAQLNEPFRETCFVGRMRITRVLLLSKSLSSWLSGCQQRRRCPQTIQKRFLRPYTFLARCLYANCCL